LEDMSTGRQADTQRMARGKQASTHNEASWQAVHQAVWLAETVTQAGRSILSHIQSGKEAGRALHGGRQAEAGGLAVKQAENGRQAETGRHEEIERQAGRDCRQT
jgi:hypothetical protein